MTAGEAVRPWSWAQNHSAFPGAVNNAVGRIPSANLSQMSGGFVPSDHIRYWAGKRPAFPGVQAADHAPPGGGDAERLKCWLRQHRRPSSCDRRLETDASARPLSTINGSLMVPWRWAVANRLFGCHEAGRVGIFGMATGDTQRRRTIAPLLSLLMPKGWPKRRFRGSAGVSRSAASGLAKSHAGPQFRPRQVFVRNPFGRRYA